MRRLYNKSLDLIIFGGALGEHSDIMENEYE